MGAPDATTPPTSVHKKRILLADDEEVVRKTVRLVLGFQGYEVEEAEDGQQAVQKFTTAAKPFDLVLLDLDMPRMGGLQALNEIRAHRADTKVVVLSGMPHNPAGDDVVFVQKPFDYQHFLRLLREILGEVPPQSPTDSAGPSPAPS